MPPQICILHDPCCVRSVRASWSLSPVALVSRWWYEIVSTIRTCFICRCCRVPQYIRSYKMQSTVSKQLCEITSSFSEHFVLMCNSDPWSATLLLFPLHLPYTAQDPCTIWSMERYWISSLSISWGLGRQRIATKNSQPFQDFVLSNSAKASS